MDWNGVSPHYLILGLLIGLSFITTLHAQDPCTQDGFNFNISFSEEDTVGTIQRVSGVGGNYVISVLQDNSVTNNNYPFDEYFEVGYNSVQMFWYIRMKKPIDRDGATSSLNDDVNILQYKFQCNAPGQPIIYSVLKIQLRDINDNSPVFFRLPYAVNISELLPVGQTFFSSMYADDKDEANNRQTYYYLTNTPGARFAGAGNFTIGLADALVAVASGLDFESMYRATGNRADLCYYNLTVRARDQGTPPQEAITYLQIGILDADDQGPVFVYPSCIRSTELYGPSCIRARYVSNLQPLSSQSLVFTPYPVDTNNPSGTVQILAQDQDTLNSQIICRIAQTVPSGFEPYFSVSTVQVGQTKQYRCVVTYSPVNNVPLSRNNLQSLDIFLQAIENTPNRRLETATISVNLAQTNTGPPVITTSPTTGYIFENSHNGTLVSQDSAMTTTLKLTFSDPDLLSSDPAPQYTIRVSGAGGIFTVTPAGYVQLLTNGLDFEQTTQYVITVTITDPATPTDTGTATVTVNALNVNDLYPRFIANYDVTVEEGNYATAPRYLMTVSAIDGDFVPVTYSMVSTSPAGSESKFSVSAAGAVTLQGTVQANQVYFINIRANDSGTPQLSAETVVVVRVAPRDTQVPPSSDNCIIICGTKYVPINIPSSTPQSSCSGVSSGVNAYSPQFAYNEYTFQILEGAREDPVVGTVSANDAVAPGTGNSAVTYSIFSQLNSSDFTIGQITGQIRSTKIFYYEAQTRYQLVVRATDPGSSPRYSDVLVNVIILPLQDTTHH